MSAKRAASGEGQGCPHRGFQRPARWLHKQIPWVAGAEVRTDNEDGGVGAKLEYFVKTGMGNREAKHLSWCLRKAK